MRDQGINGLVDSWVSLKRLEKLIDIAVDDEVEGDDSAADGIAVGRHRRFLVPSMASPTPSVASSGSKESPILELHSAAFEWTAKKDEFKLRKLSLKVLPGQLVGEI